MRNTTTLWEKDGYTLRLADKKDAKAYYAQNYCPLDREVARLTGSKRAFTEKEVLSFFENALEDPDWHYFLICSPEGRIIGESVINEIDWDRRCANFRIAIFHPEYRGRGVGTWATRLTRDYAFAGLKLHRLELEVYSFNPRAEKAYAKAGFQREGVLRDAVRDGDGYGSVILMAILESDWLALQEEK